MKSEAFLEYQGGEIRRVGDALYSDYEFNPFLALSPIFGKILIRLVEIAVETYRQTENVERYAYSLESGGDMKSGQCKYQYQPIDCCEHISAFNQG